MRHASSRKAATAFTLVEALVMIAIIGLLLILAVPTGDHRPRRATVLLCTSNLRQIGLRLQLFAEDHGGQYPPRTSITNGGSMEFVGRGSPAAHFLTLSNQMAKSSLKMWICPTDRIKKPATNYATFDDRNVSYFLSVDAAPRTTNARFIILAGDRHLEFARYPVKPGLFPLTTNGSIGWTRELHGDNKLSPAGNMVFSDGHVEFLKRDRVVTWIRSQRLATNLLAVP